MEWSPAIESFKKAGAGSTKLRNQSEQWITYVKTEKERLSPKPIAKAEGESLNPSTVVQ